jgi:exfoliative toxin A/B
MKKIINKVPVPLAGLMLALASAGNLVASYGSIYRNIFGVVSAMLLLLILAKVITNRKAVVEDMNNPVIAGVAPTFSMGIMILSTYVKPLQSSVAYFLWIVGLLIHLSLMVYFTKKFIFTFNIKKVFPSYFVVYAGIVVGSVTAPVFNAAAFGRLLFWFGLTAYLVLLPIVIYRVFVVKSIPEPALPTITIFAAPASLCLAGYMNSFQQKNMIIVWFLAILSLTMFTAVLLYMPKMLKLKFYPSFSAFTFPFVISGIAMKLTNGFLIKSEQGIPVLGYVVKFQELLAVGMVLYVLIRYIDFLFINKPVKESTPAATAAS